MYLRKLLAAAALLALSGLSAFADTLVLNDGRRIRGTLVSVSRGVVVFDEDSSYGRGRRMRVNVSRVEGIDFSDDFQTSEDPYDYGYGGMRGESVNVYAHQQWTDTGINVRAGDTLRFGASGIVSWGPGRRDGPEGEPGSPYNANRPMPDRPGAALIGRIGINEPFFIGSDTRSFRARSSGRLYLGINDDYLQDNSGNFHVVVERQ
jgi:hypothetical protein